MIARVCRAGGGGHGGHSSGGGHGISGGYGGAHSYGGGSTSGIVVLLVVIFFAWLIFRRVSRGTAAGPMVAMPLTAGTAVSAVWGAATRPSLPGALAAIRGRDPAFEIESFLQRAEMTFFLVKRGIQKNDPGAVRPYLNDAVFAVVARNIAQMSAQHQHALMESLNVRDVHLLDAACGDGGQSLVVHFDLVYRAKTLDDANRVLSDEGEDGRHGERWTFGRAGTAKTPADGGVTASRCPACGAELRLSLDGACTHCRASVTNGSVDWVVTDVQRAPFMGFAGDSLVGIAAPTVADGIASLRATDSGFEMASFLVRVNTAFMALQDAWCRQNLDGGRAFLSPGAYFGWRAQLETLAAQGRHNVMEQLHVQRIDPLRVVHGRVFDDLTVRIAAAAADYEVDADGRVVFGDRSVRPFVEEWTFQRSVGIASSGKPGTLESTCPNCGAPLALTQIGECRYCRAAVTSGRFDWVVSRIEQEPEEDTAGAAEDIGSQVASLVGGAVVGGLVSSLFSQNRD